MFSFICILVLCLTMLPSATFASAKEYLALGDSITTGYGLDPETGSSFAEQVGEEPGYKLTNEANDGETT